MTDGMDNFEELQKKHTAHWIVDKDNSRRWDRIRFYCSHCGEWQTYGLTKFCPDCGWMTQNNIEEGKGEQGT